MRKLNPRVCRGCGNVFQPTTALQRYGTLSCKALGGRYQSKAVPGATVNHPGACCCKFSDAWRCAVAQGLRDQISCWCPCHRAQLNVLGAAIR